MLDALWRSGIDLAVTVPSKYIARLIVDAEEDPRFTLLYPSREEEGARARRGRRRTIEPEEHLKPGDGTIDFPRLFGRLEGGGREHLVRAAGPPGPAISAA